MNNHMNTNLETYMFDQKDSFFTTCQVVCVPGGYAVYLDRPRTFDTPHLPSAVVQSRGEVLNLLSAHIEKLVKSNLPDTAPISGVALMKKP